MKTPLPITQVGGLALADERATILPTRSAWVSAMNTPVKASEAPIAAGDQPNLAIAKKGPGAGVDLVGDLPDQQRSGHAQHPGIFAQREQGAQRVGAFQVESPAAPGGSDSGSTKKP